MLDDHSLITAARGGDQRAYAALYRHHYRRALQEARKVVRNNADAEDSVAAAFASTFLAIRKGGGPDESFRAYLMTAVRNAALQLVRTKRYASEVVTEAPEPTVSHIDVYQIGADPAVREAFQNLPSRWQQVLWKTEIEGMPPRVLTDEMEMSATSIAALAKRARDGFRKAYLTSAVGSDPHPWALERLDLLREGALDPRTRDLVELHVENCARCQDVLAPVPMPVSAASIGLILLLGGAVAPAGTMGGGLAVGGAMVGRLRNLGSRTVGRMSAKVATLSAAAVAVVGTLVVVGISAQSDSTSRSTSPTSIGAPPTVGLPLSTDVSAGGAGSGSGGSASGGTDPAATAVAAGGTVDPSGTVAATGTSTPGGTVVGGSSSEDLAGATTASVAAGATPTTRRSTTTTRPRTTATTTIPGTPAPTPAPSTGTSVEPPRTVATIPPQAGTPSPTVAVTVAPPVTAAPTVAPTLATDPVTVPTTVAPTTTTTRPPSYGGTVSFNPLGISTATASILAVGTDGLPAGTTLQFTASSTDPSWDVTFGDITNCPDLPLSLPHGDNLNILSVQCTTTLLALGGRASVTVNVVDTTCSGAGSGVEVVVVAQRPGGSPSNPLRLTLGCAPSNNDQPAVAAN